MGSRTLVKGLVQNVQEVTFNTVLKYKVGKYCTPSGRCIQYVNYEQGQKNRACEEKPVRDPNKGVKTIKHTRAVLMGFKMHLWRVRMLCGCTHLDDEDCNPLFYNDCLFKHYLVSMDSG